MSNAAAQAGGLTELALLLGAHMVAFAGGAPNLRHPSYLGWPFNRKERESGCR